MTEACVFLPISKSNIEVGIITMYPLIVADVIIEQHTLKPKPCIPSMVPL